MAARHRERPAAGKETARPSRAERTRARLIEAAIDEFAEFGFHNAKISGIVARAGLTQPTFYLYFKSKDAVHDYLVDRVRSELKVVIEGARIPAATPAANVREKLIHAIQAFLQYIVENPKLAKIGYFDGAHDSSIREEIVALVSRNLAFEQGAGYCRGDIDPVFFSHCYNGSLERLIRVYLLSGEYDARTLAEKVADLYGYGSIPEGPARESGPGRRSED